VQQEEKEAEKNRIKKLKNKHEDDANISKLI